MARNARSWRSWRLFKVIFWKNLQWLQSKYACLCLAIHSQEIWESGQLKNVSINFPSLHFPTTTLLLHKLTGTEQSKTEILTNIFRIPLSKGCSPGVFKEGRDKVKKDQRTQKSNTPGSTKPNIFKKITAEALISL